MPSTYKTPGVYVEEIATLPASVAQVPSAIPAFIGYTEKGTDLPPTSIGSFAEFREHFGGAPPLSNLEVGPILLDVGNRPTQPISLASAFYLFDSVKLFYANGGGECYVVSVGDYGETPDKDILEAGLAKVAKEDAPTLIVIPDAAGLSSGTSDLQKSALSQCNQLGNRFSIVDLTNDQATRPDAKAFREGIGLNFSRFGAAYTPWLKTAASVEIRYRDVTEITFKKNGAEFEISNLFEDQTPVDAAELAIADSVTLSNVADINRIRRDFEAMEAEFRKDVGKQIYDRVRDFLNDNPREVLDLLGNPENDQRLRGVQAAKAIEEILAKGSPLASEAPETKKTGKATAEDFPELEKYFKQWLAAMAELRLVTGAAETKAEQDLREGSPQYRQLIRAIGETVIEVPPSGAIAGIYASVDANRGVWKAPANVSLNGIVGLTRVIDDSEQNDLNVDTTGGLSINAIRAFPGKGILVWGARTLAGNDTEWRYVPVRRLFIMVEESIKRSTGWVVFEPNDANTWIKVKAMIENYLVGLWRDGALAGATPEQAFFVNVGLGTSMTPQDILEGRMIVEVGMAAVRPAEFIILRFSHKLQEA